MIKNSFLIGSFVLVLVFFVNLSFCFALVDCSCGGTAVDNNACQEKCAGSGQLPNPLGTESPEELIGRVIQAILGVVGSLALLMFIYGGFTWMTASGNKEKVDKGKQIIIWATLGLVVIFTSYVLVRFVITSLT